MSQEVDEAGSAEAAAHFVNNTTEDRVDDDGAPAAGTHLTLSYEREAFVVKLDDRPIGLGGNAPAALLAALANAAKRDATVVQRQVLAQAYVIALDAVFFQEVVEAFADDEDEEDWDEDEGEEEED